MAKFKPSFRIFVSILAAWSIKNATALEEHLLRGRRGLAVNFHFLGFKGTEFC